MSFVRLGNTYTQEIPSWVVNILELDDIGYEIAQTVFGKNIISSKREIYVGFSRDNGILIADRKYITENIVILSNDEFKKLITTTIDRIQKDRNNIDIYYNPAEHPHKPYEQQWFNVNDTEQ